MKGDKAINILKERFNSHKLDDKHDLKMQQFTAEDMIDFAYFVAMSSLEKASENPHCFDESGYYAEYLNPNEVNQESNIILL